MTGSIKNSAYVSGTKLFVAQTRQVRDIDGACLTPQLLPATVVNELEVES